MRKSLKQKQIKLKEIRDKSKNMTKEERVKKRYFKTKFFNMCSFTGRTNGIYTRLFFGMTGEGAISRIALREKIASGEIPGITKSSW